MKWSTTATIFDLRPLHRHRQRAMHSGRNGLGYHRFVDRLALSGRIVPGESFDFVVTVVAQGHMQGRVGENGQYFIRHFPGIPEVHLEGVS